MSEPLKSCPACVGDTAAVYGDQVLCVFCKCAGPYGHDARAAWNALPRRDLEVEAKAAVLDWLQAIAPDVSDSLEENIRRGLAEERKKRGLP